MKSNAVRYCVIAALSLTLGSAHALVPLEGLLQGEVDQELQHDPMSYVFQRPAETSEADRSLHKLYIAHTDEAQLLQQSCDFVGNANYASPVDEDRARRSLVATLQYVGLDLSVKAIGRYAQTLQMSEEDYTKFVNNLMASSCSPNLSVYGHKLIKQNLVASFKRTDYQIPAFPGTPFVATKYAEKSNALTSKELELHHTVQNFRALCSWGGDTRNYRLLPPLLSNPLVMATVVRHLENRSLVWDPAGQRVRSIEGKGAVQVNCQDLICRRVENAEFLRSYPRLIGSSGLKQDLTRLWCRDFRDQSIQDNDRQHPQIRAWLKKLEPVHERQMVSQMVALMTGVPDAMVMVKQYSELKEDMRLGIDERWDQWAKKALAGFSKDILYEESLEIKVQPRRDLATIRQEPFVVDLNVTMGELDRLFPAEDKLQLDVDLKVSQSWLRWIRRQWNVVNQQGDPAAMEAFTDQIAEYLAPQIESKKKYFPTPLFNGGLEHVLAKELLEQVLRYQGKMFETMEDKIVIMPLRFHYGMFALSYMRYKARIKDQHQSLDL